MTETPRHTSRRAFLGRMTAASLGAMAARGVYDILDGGGTVERAEAAATVRRFQEQYLVRNVEVILDNGVTLAIPPLYNDVFTATLSSKVNWTVAALKSAQTRLEKALATVEAPYTDNASGLTMVIAWGLPYFDLLRTKTATLPVELPIDTELSKATGSTQYAVLKARQFPSDATDLLLEENHVVFKMRSDSSAILQKVERQLFDDASSGAYIGDLFDLTSKRIGFLGRGFGSTDGGSIAKHLALAANVPGADKIPDRAQLMLGFTSTQTQALGPDNIPSFETLPGVTNQFPSGYFASGCAMHLSHLKTDLVKWYGYAYDKRVARMFSSTTPVPADATVTIPNGPAEAAANNIDKDAAAGIIGHNTALQQATRLAADTVDNYGRRRPKGTPVPLREDFNTVDNPFHWTSNPTRDQYSDQGAAGLHFVAFVPSSNKFHTARRVMDGVRLTDGADLAPSAGGVGNVGLNAVTQATHRQNFLVPPRSHRSFPIVELMK